MQYPLVLAGLVALCSLAVRASPIAADADAAAARERADSALELPGTGTAPEKSPLAQRLEDEFAAWESRVGKRQLTDPTLEDCSYFAPNGIQVGCWRTLNMSGYLNDWWGNNSARCAQNKKGFSECYLETAGYISWSCDFIGLNTCVPPPSGEGAHYKSYQEFYTFWNIYSVNVFYTNYHGALLSGEASAMGAVAEIVGLVSPPKHLNPTTPLFGPIWSISLTEVMALAPLLPASLPVALAFGLFFGAGYGVSGSYSLLFPPHDINEVSWEKLADALGDHVNKYQKNVGRALEFTMSDFYAFMNLTQFGTFSQKLEIRLPEQTDFVYHSLMKWILNQALYKGGWFLAKNTGLDPRKIPTNAYLCAELDKDGRCEHVWFHGNDTHGDTYGLIRAHDIGASRGAKILDIAIQKNWTTLSELYLDSESCRGKEPTGEFDVDDMTMGCVSNLPVCEFFFDFNPFDRLIDRHNPPEFTNCPNQRGYGMPPFHSNDAGVPLPYLGPFLYSGYTYNEKRG